MPIARLRFVTCNDPISAAIRYAEDFWASHVEAEVPDWHPGAPLDPKPVGYLGAHADGGVRVRPLGYDAARLQREEFVALPMSDEMYASWLGYLYSRIGMPYDFAAIFGFVARFGAHERDHVICSALQAADLSFCRFLPGLILAPEQTSPRDLLLILSGYVAPALLLKAAA